MRTLLEARSVGPPAWAITESSVIRSSLLNSRAPGDLSSPMQKILIVRRGATLTTSPGTIGMFQMGLAAWKSSSVSTSSVSESPLSALRRT